MLRWTVSLDEVFLVVSVKTCCIIVAERQRKINSLSVAFVPTEAYEDWINEHCTQRSPQLTIDLNSSKPHCEKVWWASDDLNWLQSIRRQTNLPVALLVTVCHDDRGDKHHWLSFPSTHGKLSPTTPPNTTYAIYTSEERFQKVSWKSIISHKDTFSLRLRFFSDFSEIFQWRFFTDRQTEDQVERL